MTAFFCIMKTPRSVSYTHLDVYKRQITNEKYVPYCIEPSLGADRVALAFLVEAYDEEELEGGDTRVVMHLHPALAPIKAAVLPLSKKLDEGATAVYEQLSKKFNCEYDLSLIHIFRINSD